MQCRDTNGAALRKNESSVADVFQIVLSDCMRYETGVYQLLSSQFPWARVSHRFHSFSLSLLFLEKKTLRSGIWTPSILAMT